MSSALMSDPAAAPRGFTLPGGPASTLPLPPPRAPLQPMPGLQLPGAGQFHTQPVGPPMPATPAAPAAPRPAIPYGSSVTGTYGSSGDPIMDAIRNLIAGQANARARALRSAALGSVHGDPSLAAFAGLQGLVGAQSDAANALNSDVLRWGQTKEQQDFEKMMSELGYQHQLGYAQATAGNPLVQLLGQIGGAAAGSYFGKH